ncbi:MAG: hypothetical protein KDA61_22280, partial [Planctomycetales bacterium]|nr:hypothetical protein [Planctomycetales bacterium]
DKQWGETGWAFVQLVLDEEHCVDQLDVWCRERLGSFQRPVRIISLKKLPLGPSGKIDKTALRQIALAEAHQ